MFPPQAHLPLDSGQCKAGRHVVHQMLPHYPGGIHFMTARTTGIFSWDRVYDLPNFRRLDRALSRLPDREIIDALRARRGRPQRVSCGRPMAGPGGYGGVPACVCCLAGSEVAAQPGAAVALLGFVLLPRQGRPRRWVDEDGVARIVHAPMRRLVPGEWVFSRLMVNLVRLKEERGLVNGMVNRPRDSQMAALPDYGEHPGADGKALESLSTGQVNRRSGEESNRDADRGHHSIHGVDGKGGPGRR